LLAAAKEIKQAFEQSPALFNMEATINGERFILNESVAHGLFENGEVMHSSPSKREKFMLIDSSSLSHFSYSLLMRSLATQAICVVDLYLLLREHNVIYPIDNEPIWLSQVRYQPRQFGPGRTFFASVTS